MDSVRRVSVIGAGAWGTALAAAVAHNGLAVRLWAREPEVAETINERRENPQFLPGARLPEAIAAATDLGEAAAAGDILLLVVPAQYVRAMTAALAALLPAPRPVVVCSKGIEQRSAALMSEVIAETLPECPLAILSGPTFAREVMDGLPTAVTLACSDAALGETLIAALGSRSLRPYYTDDVIGTQIGGAVKNVLAIACGIASGRGLGDNARAALITRGLSEIGRLSAALGGRPETLAGLSGLGDLVLTCTSTQSRNFSLGVEVGRGEPLERILSGRKSVAEGVATASSVVARAAKLDIEMPISQAVDAVLHRGADLDQTIESLLSRPFRTETRL